jgi:hypothetical protein
MSILAQAVSLFRVREDCPADYHFGADDIGQLHRVAGGAGTGPLDDQSWTDLLLDQYSAELSGEVSIFGRQLLHQRLRAGLDDDARAVMKGRLQMLMREPGELDELHRTLRSLRHADTEVAALLFEQERPQPPAWAGRTWPLPLALLASVAAVAISPLAWLAVALTLYLLISAQLRYHEQIQAWAGATTSLQMLLRVQSLLGARAGTVGRDFADGRELAGRINRGLSRSRLANGVPGAGEYADWFLLANVNHYFRSVELVFAQRAFLRECYLRCANLEADVALARHLLRVPAWCWAGRGAPDCAELRRAVHPLLPGAAPLSISLQGKGAFISGRNGVGKSTFLRTVGLNLVAARAFGFCYAEHAHLPALPVYTSMRSEDSLPGAESLYMAELRRAKELLAAADGPHPGLYLIDEIFCGTNHAESVAAAAAVIDALAARGLVIVSSHNLLLAPLLAHRLDPYCIGAASGDLALEPGVLADTNGIALLSAHGFAPRVQQNAAKVAHWLSGYLGQPHAGADLLDEANRGRQPADTLTLRAAAACPSRSPRGSRPS